MAKGVQQHLGMKQDTGRKGEGMAGFGTLFYSMLSISLII